MAEHGKRMIGRKPGALSPHTEAIREIRDAHSAKDYNSVWNRMRKDERFQAIDADNVRFKATGTIIKKSTFPSTLSRLRNK